MNKNRLTGGARAHCPYCGRPPEPTAAPNRRDQITWKIERRADFSDKLVLLIRGIDRMRWVVTEFSIRPEDVLSLRAALNEWDQTNGISLEKHRP